MRTLLIDGDLYAYVESIVVEEVVSWENKPGLFTLHSNVGPAMANFASLITKLQRELNADKVLVALSDPNGRNWRVDLWPQYKAHRRKLGRYSRSGFSKKSHEVERTGVEPSTSALRTQRSPN